MFFAAVKRCRNLCCKLLCFLAIRFQNWELLLYDRDSRCFPFLRAQVQMRFCYRKIYMICLRVHDWVILCSVIPFVCLLGVKTAVKITCAYVPRCAFHDSKFSDYVENCFRLFFTGSNVTDHNAVFQSGIHRAPSWVRLGCKLINMFSWFEVEWMC